jgi:hypothetical protein
MCTKDRPLYLWNLVTLGPSTWDYDARPSIGISLKLGRQNVDGTPVTQIEYTWERSTSKIWYDASDISGVFFIAEGIKIIPSNGPSRLFLNCTEASCAP